MILLGGDETFEIQPISAIPLYTIIFVKRVILQWWDAFLTSHFDVGLDGSQNLMRSGNNFYAGHQIFEARRHFCALRTSSQILTQESKFSFWIADIKN